MGDIIKVEGQSGITATGWSLTEITEDQWHSAGEVLVKIDQARQWWLGDWWNACKWGDGKQACDTLGINYQTAVDCGNVAKKMQSKRRRLDLSFSHHREVCPIDDESMQDRLLDWAESDNASVKAIRSKVQAYLAMSDWAESEKDRRFTVEENGETVVANINDDVNIINWAKSEGRYVFIGRGQYDLGWGNPYELDIDGDRDQVCESHVAYFKFKLGLNAKIAKLKGKVLGCYCFPERCHGDFLASRANNK